MTSANDSRPEFSILVDGKELPEGKRDDVVEVEVVEQVGKLAQARVVLRNWDPDGNVPEEDEDSFKLTIGKELVIKLGWGSDLVEVFDGLIAATRALCRPGNVPRLELKGRCRGLLLRGTERFQVWTDKSDFDAASSLCSKVGLKAEGKAGFTHPFLVQHRVPDWDFLRERAAALGCSLYVRGKSLNFQPPATSGKPIADFEWPETLLDADLTADLRETFAGAKLQAWSPDDKQVRSVEAKASASKLPQGSRPDPTDQLGAAKLTSSRTRASSESAPLEPAELEAWGQAQVDRSRALACHGSASFEGAPAVRIDAVIELTGIGKDVDGAHYVTRARHHLRPGRYTTHVQLGHDPATINAPTTATERHPGLAFPAVHSLVIATVESFEDAEAKLARVQVRFPWMSAEEPAIWARLATPGAGAGRGVLFVPEPEDEVLVQFLEGDPRHPVVVGSLWNGVDAPPEAYDPQKNDRRALVSRSGHAVVLDDGEDAPQVAIRTAAKQEVVLDDTSGSECITLKDKTGNEVRMDSKGIALTAASGKTIALTASGGTIEMAAANIKAKADQGFEAEAGASLALKASGQAGLEGAQTEVKGSAMVQVQAPMVKLN